jgi:hypothetical protein
LSPGRWVFAAIPKRVSQVFSEADAAGYLSTLITYCCVFSLCALSRMC